MTQPASRDVHQDALLTQTLIGYKNPLYIADDVFPVVRVAKQSGIVPKLKQSHFFRDRARLRAPGTKSTGGGFETDLTDTYFAHRYSHREELPDDVRDNADAPFDMERLHAESAGDAVWLKREISFAADHFAATKWGADKVVTTDFTLWSDYAGSDPLVNIADWQDEVEGKVGREANTLLIGKQVWAKLKWHPDFVDAIKFTQIGVVTAALAVEVSGIGRILIGRAIKTIDPEGTAEAAVTYTRVWGKHGLIAYVDPAPSIMTPTAGMTITWERVPGALQYIKRMRDEEREVDIFEANSYFHQKQTVKNAGVFASGLVA